YNGTWPSAVIQDSVVGPSSTFPSTPGQTYYVWVHTRNPIDGSYSADINGNVYCVPTPPPTTPSVGVTISSPKVLADNSTQYNIVVTGIDPGGAGKISDEYALINL